MGTLMGFECLFALLGSTSTIDEPESENVLLLFLEFDSYVFFLHYTVLVNFFGLKQFECEIRTTYVYDVGLVF